ncbi:transcriptional regulator [Longispora fulva]|nr:transcriptional regulator [Longispora fulva]
MRKSPAVRRRRLGIMLRRIREEAGLTADKVAKELAVAGSTITRIEKGESAGRPGMLRDLLDHYDVGSPQREVLVQLGREGRQKGLYDAYGTVMIAAYADLEAEAETITQFENVLVPGLLQTADYTRAIIRAVRPDIGVDELARSVELRLARQAMLDRDDPPELRLILDEAALRRIVGGRDVMCAQLAWLIQRARLSHVTLQIVPLAVGAHAGMSGAFTILGYSEPELDLVYLGNASGGLYLEKAADIRWYLITHERLRAAALSPVDSLALLAAVAEEFACPAESPPST